MPAEVYLIHCLANKLAALACNTAFKKLTIKYNIATQGKSYNSPA